MSSIFPCHRFFVHRCVLYAASDYFKALFTSNMKEKDKKEIDLHDVSGRILGQLIHYCYTLDITIDQENVEAVLAAANFYGFVDIVAKCEVFCQKNLTAATALSYLALADKFSLVDLHAPAEYYVFRHFMKIVEDASFLHLAADDVSNLLQRNEITVRSEIDIFDAATKWIDADVNERKSHFPMLMEAVRLSNVDEKVSFFPSLFVHQDGHH